MFKFITREKDPSRTNAFQNAKSTVVKKGSSKFQRATRFFRNQYRHPTIICWFERATGNLINFQQQSRTSSEITGCFERTMVLYMPRAQQQSFYSTGFSYFRFQYNGLRLPLRIQLLGYFVIFEGKRFSRDTSRAQAVERSSTTLPFPNQIPFAISGCASSKGQPSLKEQHLLQEQALRAGRCKFVWIRTYSNSTVHERKPVR